MSKRALLKTIAFLVGLYFFLEYVLPDKVGGDFDAYEVNSPVAANADGHEFQYYVGVYDKGRGAIGRLDKEGDSWTRREEPVMQRSLFLRYDQYGLEQPDVCRKEATICLLYMGTNDKEPVLCYAESADGLAFEKKGAVILSTNGVFKASEEQPNGLFGEKIKGFAAECRNGVFDLWLFTQTYRVWHASGESLKHLLLDKEPLVAAPLTGKSPNGFDAFTEKDGVCLLYIMDRSLVEFRRDGAGVWQPKTWKAASDLGTNIVNYASGRMDTISHTLYVGTTQRRSARPIDAPYASQLCAIKLRENPDGSPFTADTTVYKSVGAQARPTYLSYGTEWAGKFLTVVGSFAIFIAMINLVLFHGKKIYQSALNYGQPQAGESEGSKASPLGRFIKAAGYSAVFLAFLAVMIVCALNGQTEEAKGTVWRTAFDFLFNAIQAPMGSAVFSMITFYMISAAYRSFKVRSLEAGFLMAAAIVCMVGQMPIGELLATLTPDSLAFLRLPWLSGKLLSVLNAAAYRAVLIGTLIGSVAISLRIWLGIDNSVYSSID